MVKIVSDDDADAASFSILKSRGYELRRELHSKSGVEYDIAEMNNDQFWGISPTEVLGLITLYEKRGEDWAPSKQENKRFDIFDKAFRRDNDTSPLQEITSELVRPNNMAVLVGLMFVSGLGIFSMIYFAAIYIREYLAANDPLTWLILPLALLGIWTIRGALIKFLQPSFKLFPEKNGSNE